MFSTGVFKVMAHGNDLKALLAPLHHWLCMDSCVSVYSVLTDTVKCACTHSSTVYFSETFV